jgi:hypothetical protein
LLDAALELTRASTSGRLLTGTAPEEGRMVPHLIVFSERDMQGRHWHVFQDVPDVGDVSFTWDDNISSFVVLAGRWQFFRDRHFEAPIGPVFEPGVVASVADAGLPNNAISSIRLVG